MPVLSSVGDVVFLFVCLFSGSPFACFTFSLPTHSHNDPKPPSFLGNHLGIKSSRLLLALISPCFLLALDPINYSSPQVSYPWLLDQGSSNSFTDHLPTNCYSLQCSPKVPSWALIFYFWLSTLVLSNGSHHHCFQMTPKRYVVFGLCSWLSTSSSFLLSFLTFAHVYPPLISESIWPFPVYQFWLPI